jgi:hypothetical protein
LRHGTVVKGIFTVCTFDKQLSTKGKPETKKVEEIGNLGTSAGAPDTDLLLTEYRYLVFVSVMGTNV